jgi:hypothetical protein
MRHGFGGPKGTVEGGVGRDFVLERLVVLGLVVILMNVWFKVGL